MATNKNATIRYQTLNRCFRNPGRKYFMEDLIKACNQALSEFNGNNEGVKRRQIFDDITFMESDQGWAIPLDRIKEGRRKYYRYRDTTFSINNQPLNEQEAQQLRETLLTLSRFKGMPQFEWVDEILARLEQSFQLKTAEKVISFQENPYLQGLNYISQLYEAIINKKVLKILYKPFYRNAIHYTIHPYHLKQYNNRWFLFGHSEEANRITNIALDRIISLDPITTEYRPNTDINFDEYFEDLIGVSILDGLEPQKVLLKINKDLWPYIETKPFHGSQKIKEKTEDYTIIQLELLLNYELESSILFHGEKVTVLAPESLRTKIKQRAKMLMANYL